MYIFLPAKEYYSKAVDEKTGIWFMYWGANRIGDDLSIWTEARYRLFEMIANPNQLVLRTGLIYYLDQHASLAGGYAYIKTWPFDQSNKDSLTSNENRLWQQFVLKNKLWLIEFEHRYRLEQRWINSGVTEYSNRARYRLLMILPLANEELQPETFFIVTYNEVFLNIGNGDVFDQNRLYFALGY